MVYENLSTDDKRFLLNYHLIEAAKADDLELFQSLITQGAEINADNGIVLIEATAKNKIRILKYLQKIGVDLDGRKDELIRIAYLNDCLDVAKYLARQGADLDIVEGKFKEQLIDYMTSIDELAILDNDLKSITANKDKSIGKV